MRTARFLRIVVGRVSYEILKAESSTCLGRGAAWSEGPFVPYDRHRYQPAYS